MTDTLLRGGISYGDRSFSPLLYRVWPPDGSLPAANGPSPAETPATPSTAPQ